MKQAPFFSIVVPTYNRASLLPTAIASVLNQSFSDWELIIVDDGSTDNTSIVVKEFDDPRIRYIYQANAERCAARNNGISHALGKYICFLDSDDYYLPERLDLLHQELQRRKLPVAMFYTGVLIDKGTSVERGKISYHTAGNIYDNIVHNIIGCPQACISREILLEYKYDIQFRIGEDMELWLRIADKYPVIYLEEQYTFVALDHDDRSVNVMRYNSGADQLKLYRYIFAETHSGEKVSKKIQRFTLAGAYHAIGRYNVHHGNRWRAALAILQALNADKQSDWSKFRVNIFAKLVTFSSMERVKNLIDYY